MPVGPQTTRPYQCSSRTSMRADDVLSELAARSIPSVHISERGRSYLVLEPPHLLRRYGLQSAAFLSIAIVLIVLMFTAVSPVFSIFLFGAAVPMLPLVVGHRPSLAVSALADDDGTTRINVHGEASPELAAALDAFVGGLPPEWTAPFSRTGAPGTPPAGAGKPSAGGRSRAGARSRLPSRRAPQSTPPAPPHAAAHADVLPADHARIPATGAGTSAAAFDQSAGVIVLFNPSCPQCRETCRLLDSRKIPITLVRYLEDVPTHDDLVRVMSLLGTDDPRFMMRTDEPIYGDLRLSTASRERCISAIVEHPILLQRPIVIRGDRAVIARPTERVLELLSPAPPGTPGSTAVPS